ncbi:MULTISPECIES: HAMP domain-containing sensor histidine kinase [Spirulina sp. CCY15215]|uniref:sensor histidine kinase n=1 Tax=Spirulina sp. CCY15215 TaxID=2767591 RepID=UPI00194EB2D3|nr:HAMP domain-containing sensor histidine kinase [Spirulina major]
MNINIDEQKGYHSNIIRLNLGRLYYRLHQPQQGMQLIEEAIANSEDQDKSRLYGARSILADNPNSEEAIALLRQIEEDSPRYQEAMQAISLNATPETTYELFADSEDSLGNTELLYRAMYHKIGNEVAILKSITYRLLRKLKDEHPLVAEIETEIDELQDSINQQRAAQKVAIAQIPKSDYRQLVTIISQTAHNISDEVNNQLAAIISKTRRAMRKIEESVPAYKNFQKLLLQLELTQNALNDLKSINEGMTIRCHRFLVRQIFEKWQPENWSTSTPRLRKTGVKLFIENPETEFDGDLEKIKSILNELVENSLKHNANHSDLLIKMCAQDLLNPSDIGTPTIPGDRKFLYIQFIDNGQGIPDNKKDWIFQPLHTTSSDDKGSGLGLFIARKTLQKMGGTMRESGRFGYGVHFQIYLPYL